ncbi:c-type cytochrome [Methyloprofundus sedimenti]|uniref:c-type cytochrome n=1 Tax=Methyloprofundus sedimenti TaxID=1420851 RepID=UPI00117DC341|nr:c-type cytochrome [Methyloprofundus sedimenti]
MKKTLIACIILLGGTSMASVADSIKPKTLVTIADAKTSPAITLDLGKPGDTIGDQWLFDQPLLDVDRNKIGNNSGVCIRTKVGNSSQCQWTLTLINGTIQVAGREFDQGSSAIGIVGGTGEYQHISGELISFKNSDGTYTQTLTYTLANDINSKQPTDAKSLITHVCENGHYSCAECHSETGNPPITDKYDKQSPSLAGQNYQYLLTQLNHFKSGNRYTKEMANTLQDYNADEINQIAFYFSQQTQTTALPFDPSIDTLKHSITEDKLWADKGRVLYQQGDKARGIMACQSCHGLSGEGDSQQTIPKLRAQHARYVRMTLHAYKTGRRTTDKTLDNVMRKSVKNLNDDDIKYLSAYIQSMAVAP